MKTGIPMWGVIALLLSTASSVATGEPRSGYRERTGFFGGFSLGVAEGNFDMETGNDEADTGVALDFRAGWAFFDRFGVSVGAYPAIFAYEYKAGMGPTDTGVATRDLSFSMFDVSAWYWHPIYSDSWKLFARLGGGKTQAKDEFDKKEIASESSGGIVASGGAEWFLWDHWAFVGEIYFRTFGVTLKGMDDKEVQTSGLLIGMVYR